MVNPEKLQKVLIWQNLINYCIYCLVDINEIVCNYLNSKNIFINNVNLLIILLFYVIMSFSHSDII